MQPTLAIARTSALIANALWSHTAAGSLAKMGRILEEDGLPMPKLSIKATVKPRDATEGTVEITAGLHVQCKIELTREHAAAAGEGTRPPCNNPQGIYEAYWLYLEGLKPEGTPNSLILAKPLVVTDLEAKVVTGEAVFQAPPKPGTYTLRAHITSTSVIGVSCSVTSASWSLRTMCPTSSELAQPRVRRGHGAREYAERARVEWRASDLTRNEKDDTCVSMCERAVCFAGVDLNSKRELSGRSGAVVIARDRRPRAPRCHRPRVNLAPRVSSL